MNTDLTCPTALPLDDEERALRTRVCILEAALACIEREADVALSRPDIAFLTLCRISAVARQSSEVRESRKRPRLARTSR